MPAPGKRPDELRRRAIRLTPGRPGRPGPVQGVFQARGRRAGGQPRSSLLVWCSFGQVVMGGRAARPPSPPVLSVWSMSVRCRSEVWERYRRSPYCHSSLLWQGGADQGACGVAVGEDPGRRLRGAGSGGPGRSMGLLRPDLGPVLAGEGREGCWVRLGVDQHLGDLGERVLQGVDDVLVLGHDGLPAGGGEDRGDQGACGLGCGPGRARVVMLRAKRGAAALPGGPGRDGPDGGADAGVGVTGSPGPRPRGRGVRGP
mgnify:CR=1 FL=1